MKVTNYGALMMKLQMSQTALLIALLQDDKNTKQIEDLANSISDLVVECKDFLNENT